MENDFEVLTAHSVDEAGVQAWDTFSAGRPFQSARWYRYGESVMQGCLPIYIILSRDKVPLARGTFWLVRQEPLPVPALLQSGISAYLKHRPLLICRSPLSSSSGLILPEPPIRLQALQAISDRAFQEARRLDCSILLFDFIDAAELKYPWPGGFAHLSIPNPGTWLENRWTDFDDFLRSAGKQNRQHFLRSQRKAMEMGIRVDRLPGVPDIEEALLLIHNVEKKYKSSSDPWTRKMLEYLTSIGGTYLRATIAGQPVGCGLLFSDGGTQLATSLGIAEGMPYVYFQLIYASLQEGLEKKERVLRLGSGTYEVKQRLGFELEQNNNVVYRAIGLLPGLVARLAATFEGS
jgi:predicted N-acyltransferase